MELAQPAKPQLPKPQPVKLTEVKWTVSDEGGFCLGSTGYESLAKNNAELLRWVKEASWQLKYYTN